MRNSRFLTLRGSSILAAPAIVHTAAYANTLTRLIPDLYAALDVVSREMVGFVPSASRAPNAERAAVGQSVVYPISVAKSAKDIVPAMQVPEPRDTVTENGTMAITKSRAVEFGYTGEEQRGLNTGPGYLSVQAGNIAQALRTLTNEVENDLAVEAIANASRAYGEAGTTPFEGPKLTETAQMRRILNDNGAPITGRSLVMNSAASANLISLQNLTRANENGSQMTLRQGELLDIHGFSMKETGATMEHAAGTAASATTDGTGYAVGATTINLASAGTGNIVAGDVISFAGDSERYVVVSGDASTADGGSITIARPGLRTAIPAAATAVTLADDYAASVAFSQDALHVVMRQPALPVEGDMAIDRMAITDVRSGVTYEVAVYPGYRKVSMEVGLAWGVKAAKREHIALLLG